jgi:CheY-like chemotaxis protein
VPRLVLVADDSPTHQRRAQGILTGEGLEVLTVSNGVAAIKKLPTIIPALILADVSMPGRDGYEVCEFVKNSPDLMRVPVLLIYSDLEPYDEARAARVRADGRIKKPFGQDELLAVVHRFLAEAEEAAPPPPRPVVSEPAYVTEPVDLPPEESASVNAPDLGALSESPAFAENFAGESAPEFAPPSYSIEEAFARSTAEEAAAEAPSFESASLPEIPPPPEAAPPDGAEPMLVEEDSGAAAEPEPGARTMIFRMPVQIAEPILADDLAPAPPVEEAPSAPPEVAEAPPPESLSLAEAAASEVSVPPPPTEAPAAPEEVAPPAAEEIPPPSPPEAELPAAPPQAAPAAEAATSTAAVLDTDLVYWIVHNVVVRMAPPALPTSTVEELIRQITDEMINELTQPPPEPQG